MKNKMVKIIGITGATLLAACVAAKLISERKEVKDAWDEEDWEEDDEPLPEFDDDKPYVPLTKEVQEICIERAFAYHGITYDFVIQRREDGKCNFERRAYFRPKVYFTEGGEHIMSAGSVSDEMFMDLSVLETVYEFLQDTKYGITDGKPKELGESYSSTATIVTIKTDVQNAMEDGKCMEFNCYVWEKEDQQKLEKLLKEYAKVFTDGYDHLEDDPSVPWPKEDVNDSAPVKKAKNKKTAPKEQ